MVVLQCYAHRSTQDAHTRDGQTKQADLAAVEEQLREIRFPLDPLPYI